jgi:hypothetical protein
VKWEEYAKASENILSSPLVPSSLDIISLIKRVNPTRLTLSESERERGYQLKNRLQSLLLEHYGDTFHLIPHPVSPNIILIKHRALPSIDACHADRASLSSEAIARVETAASLHPRREQPKPNREKWPLETGVVLSPKDALKKGQALLDEYDYTAAEEVLAGIRARGPGDLQVVARGAAILLHEIGAFQRCIDTLLTQPKHVLKDRGIRELLAVAYHHNGSVAEARALLYELHPAELGLEALFAYAEIAFKDGNLSAAMELVRLARGKEGYLSDLDALQSEIEEAMLALAEPVAQRARAALQSAAIEEARRLAREALDLSPDCQEARAVICAIEAIDAERQLAGLWASLENEASGERRVALLTTLLERDEERRETIKKLIAEEKERQRRIFFDEQLESLRDLVLKECWPECFDVVTVLMRQPEFGGRGSEVLSLSPFFPVLHENRRLHAINDRSAKDLWLRFVKVKTALAAGKGGGCLETLEELKPWFNARPEFQEDYLILLQGEQEQARKEIADLLGQSGAPGRPISEVRLLHGCVKRRMQVLPLEERRALLQLLEGRLASSITEQDPGQPLEEYREALQLGNREKAAYLRQEITDIDALEQIRAEVAEAFHIAVEPLTLELSDNLPIDLTTPPPLTIYFYCGRRFFLRDGPDALVMIDFAANTACRMSSPVFAKAVICDHSKEGSLLFVEKKEADECGDRVWRAELSAEPAAFTANFNMREWFDVEDGFSIIDIRSSSEKDTDYYLLIQRDEGSSPAKVFKKRLAPKGTVETLQLGNCTELMMWRCTSCPDSFIIVGEGQTRYVNRNLTSKSTIHGALNIYKIDEDDGCIYANEQKFFLTKRDIKLRLMKSYEKAIGLSLFEPKRVHGLSMQTGMALVVLGDGRQAFYHLANNKFSSKIRMGRVIPSDNEGKWYCFDYDRKERKLSLRDITEEIHTELEWGEFFHPDKPEGNQELLEWFHRSENFVYRPGEWEASDPAT